MNSSTQDTPTPTPNHEGMDTTEIKVGIIGAGHIAHIHARHSTRVVGTRLTAIADMHLPKAEELAASYGATAYESVVSLLSGAEVDAVIVATPTETHGPIVEQALAAGKHVLCEKPMGLTTTECDAMIAAAKQAGKHLAVGQVVRFFPEYSNAKRQIDSGAVGKPAAVRVRRTVGGRPDNSDWYSDPKRGGGVMFDLLVHEFDWLQWCFGPITRVYAQSLTPKLAAGNVSIDYALLTLRHATGVITHVEGCWGNPNGFSTAFEVAGDGGLLSHDSRRATSLVRSIPGSKPVASGPLYLHNDPYYQQLVAFTETVRTGITLLATGEEGRAAVAIAEAAVLSAKTGLAVTLEG